MDYIVQENSPQSSDIEITIEMKSKNEILKNYLEPEKKKSLFKMILKALETKFSKSKSLSKSKKSPCAHTNKKLTLNNQKQMLQLCTSQANIKLLTSDTEEETEKELNSSEQQVHTINILSVQNLKSQSTIEISLQSPSKNNIENNYNTDIAFLKSDSQDTKSKTSISENNQPNYQYKILSHSLPVDLNISYPSFDKNNIQNKQSQRKQLIRNLILETMDAILEQNDDFDEEENTTNSEKNFDGFCQVPLQSTENIFNNPSEIIDNNTKEKLNKYTKFTPQSGNYEIGDHSTIYPNSYRSSKKENNFTENYHLIHDIYNRLVSLEKKMDNEKRNSESCIKHMSVQCSDSTFSDKENRTLQSKYIDDTFIPCNDSAFEYIRGKVIPKRLYHRDISCNTSNVTVFNTNKPKIKSEEKINFKNTISKMSIDKSEQLKFKNEEKFKLKNIISKSSIGKIEQLKSENEDKMKLKNNVSKSNINIDKLEQFKSKNEEKIHLKTTISKSSAITDKSKSIKFCNKLLWDGKLVNSDFDLKQKVDEIVNEKLSELQVKSILKEQSSLETELPSSFRESSNQTTSFDLTDIVLKNSVNRMPSFENLSPHLISNLNLKLTSSGDSPTTFPTQKTSCDEIQNIITESNKKLSLRKRISKLVSNISLKSKTKNDQFSPCIPNFWKRKTSSNSSSNRTTTEPSLESSTNSILNPNSKWNRLFTNTNTKSSFNNKKCASPHEIFPDSEKASFKNDVFDVKLEYISNNTQIKSKDMKNNIIYVPKSNNFFSKPRCIVNEKDIEEFEYDEKIYFYEKPINKEKSMFDRNYKNNSKSAGSDISFLKLYDFLLTANNPANYKILRNLYKKMINNGSSSDVFTEEQVTLFKRKNQCSSKLSVQSDDSIDVSITLSELKTLVEDTEINKWIS